RITRYRRGSYLCVYIYFESPTTNKLYLNKIIFFSSRRRHTSFSRDWSSDVCSSDLEDKGGYDINALWIDSKFDSLVFREKLSAAPELDESVLLKYKLVESEKPTVRKSATNETIDASKLPEAFKQRIIQDIESQKGFKRWKANGCANFNCPFHDDQHPSAGYNRDTHIFKCLGGCGEMNAKEYG